MIMGIYKRIIGSVIVNGCLTALLWGMAIYIHVVNNGQEVTSFGAQIAISLVTTLGTITGCFIGLLIGWVNESTVKSFIIAAVVCSVFGLGLFISDSRHYTPFPEEALKRVMFLVLPIVLAALSAGGTAKLFNSLLKAE
jgi:hypothetical protein